MNPRVGRLPIIILTLLLALSVSIPAFASRTVKNPFGKCILAFPDLEQKTGEAVAKVAVFEKMRSVEVLGFEPGTHGGRRLRIKRLKNEYGELMGWASNFAERHYDLQGDPRTFISAIGPKAAAYFGFEKISDTEYLIPNAIEFEAALKKVNQQLVLMGQRVLSFGFYPTKTNADVQVKKYVDRIRSELLMPLAPDGHHLIHDIAFHAGMVFGPEPLGRLMKAEADLHASFFEYLNDKYKADSTVLPQLQALQYVSDFIDTMRFDGLTGSLGQNFALIRSENSKELFKYVEERMQTYLDYPSMHPSIEAIDSTGRKPEHIFFIPGGWSLADRFLTFLMVLQNPAKYQMRSFTNQSHLNMNKLATAMKSSSAGYQTATLVDDFHEFVAQYKSPLAIDIRSTPDDILLGPRGTFERDGDELSKDPSWYKIFCDEVRKNKLRVIEAVEQLQQKL